MAGVDFFGVYDFTFGELLEQIKVQNEIKRRKNKDASVIAHGQAFLICNLISEGGSHQVYEAFPYWTEEEIQQMELEMLKNRMKKIVAKGR